MRTEVLCISVLTVASGPRVKLARCKRALNAPVVCSTHRSKAVVLVLFLLFVALWFPHCFMCFLLRVPSSIAAHFAFCFTSCVVVLAFW